MMTSPTLLIDTAFESCQVALAQGDMILDSCVLQSAGGHDRVLATAVRDLLHRHGTDVTQLNKIAVTTGPGRFNGLRVGIAFARGLALVHQTPLVGIATSDIFLEEAKSYPATSAIVMDVKRGEHFTVIANDPSRLIRSVVTNELLDTLNSHHITHIIGSMTAETQAHLSAGAMTVLSQHAVPCLRAMAKLAYDINSLGQMPVRPYYGAA